MVIRTNMMSLRTYREYRKNASATAKNLEKLSSGFRINRAADDASGLCASERMRAKITELDRCGSNAQEGLNLTKTADGALAEVNDMLRRARELCIQAANGTYSKQELAAISDEMNQLFSEIDRITEGSRFNEIQLFRGDLGPDFHYEYDEVFSPVDPTKGTEIWGSIDFVETGSFDNATQAKSATATFHLNGIKIPADLDGKSLTVNNKTYYFSDSSSGAPAGATVYNWKNYSSLQSIFSSVFNNSLRNNYQLDPVSVGINGDTVTVTAPRRDITDTCFIDGADTLLRVEKGAGAWVNGVSVTSGGGSLGEVDPAVNNPVYGDLTGTFSLKNVPDVLTADQADSLNKNSLNVFGMKVPLQPGNFSAGMSRDQVGQKVAQLIDEKFKAGNYVNYKAEYDDTKDELKVSFENKTGSTTSPTWANLYEERPYTYVPRNNGNKITASALGVKVDVRASEKNEVSEITIPDDLSKPFGIKIGSYTHLYYNSTTHPLTDDKHPSTDYSTTYLHDISTLSGSVLDDIVSRIRSHITAAGGTVEVNGNKIIAKDPAANHSLGLKSSISGVSATATAYKGSYNDYHSDLVLGKQVSGVTGIIGTSEYSGYFQQNVNVSFAVDGDDVSALASKGFNINGHRWAFVNNGEPATVPDGYTKIELSGFADINALASDLQNRMNGYTVKFDVDTGKLVFDWYKTANSSAVTVTDGYKGSIMTEPDGVKFEGGADTGHSQKRIDFSSITAENMNDLLGKGFRINCASCEGEFINVLFCHEKGDMPESFEIEIDPTTGNRVPNGSGGQKVLIRNYAVELSKVSSPQQIVSSIVQQLSGQLGHFTTVEQAPDNPLVLLAQDKRYGVITHPVSHQPTLGSVEGGIEANFTYSVNIRKVEDYPADGSVLMKDNIVEIYVGSDPNPQIIPIHLPYIDLKTLRLRPPETVDLNDASQDASDWLNRVDRANLAISKSRGVIGADHNRLEHAVKELSNAHINLTDAESRIRDADIAQEMMEHVKLQILTQAQQGMLAQANSQPQQILQLIS